jgi:CDP-glycerol glycerophosphotransferase (TagB/SpsB family)
MGEKVVVKAVLFCNLPYAFSILKPLADELKNRSFDYIWYLPKELISIFPYPKEPNESDIKKIESFKSDMIFVPGNDLPWYLRGVKVQIFHGLAGEKKGHFRIRDYFDLYLTQGPYFTKRFVELVDKHKNFSVKETGWCKLDKLYSQDREIDKRRRELLSRSKAKNIILYAPTFSPSLSSAEKLYEKIIKLSKKDDYLMIIKFHDKMDREIQKRYEDKQSQKLLVLKDSDITDALKISDLMISDTSSVVYEFLLLDKPVITLNSHSENISWEDIDNPDILEQKIDDIFAGVDEFKDKREEVINLYHPYSDGRSASRMVDAVLEYIDKYKVPDKRELPITRKIKMIKKYGLFRW